MPILSLTEVARGEARVDGEISPDDPLWEGAAVKLAEPLKVRLAAQSVDRVAALVLGVLSLVLAWARRVG